MDGINLAAYNSAPQILADDGGYSIDLSPGVSSDDDFTMKMWYAGCRIFKGIGESGVYHFQSKSTLRVVKNDGSRQFLMKWGIIQSTFNKYYIRRGTPYMGPLTEPTGGSNAAGEDKGMDKAKAVS